MLLVEVIRFLTYLREKPVANNTIEAYRIDLNQLVTYLEQQGLRSWEDIKRKNIETFVAFQKQNGRQDSTLARKAAAIKAFFEYLTAEERLTVNPVEAFSVPGGTYKTPLFISGDEQQRLQAYFRTKISPLDTRNALLYGLMLATGLEISQVLQLNLSSVRLDQLPWTISYQSRHHYDGQTNKQVEINMELGLCIRDYVLLSRPKLGPKRGERALFISQHGRRLTRASAWLALTNLGQDARLESPVNPQTVHNTFLHNKALQEVLAESTRRPDIDFSDHWEEVKDLAYHEV